MTLNAHGSNVLKTLTEFHKERIESEERLRVFREFQEEYEEDGVIPKSLNLSLRRHERTLEYIAGILAGIFIGEFSVVLVFYIVNKLLHLQF